MQIHVQNAPFVYNPDTISVGLGFSKGGEKKKWLVEYSTSKISVSVVFNLFFFFLSPATFIYYITS